MLWKKYKHIYLAFGTAFAFSMTLLFLGTNGFFEARETPEPEIQVVNLANEEEFLISYNTYIYKETEYKLCGTFETKLVTDMEKYIGLSLDQVKEAFYSKDDGWNMEIINEKSVIFYNSVNQLCSIHLERRHLGVEGEKVAIFYGPADVDAGIARETDIYVYKLPENIREELYTKKLEFNSEEEALQAIDSLEEFIH